MARALAAAAESKYRVALLQLAAVARLHQSCTRRRLCRTWTYAGMALQSGTRWVVERLNFVAIRKSSRRDGHDWVMARAKVHRYCLCHFC